MSRDIFVQDLPPHARSVRDIPDDWRPRELPFGADVVKAAILELAPDANFTVLGVGHVRLPGVDIEVSFGEAVPLSSFALHVRTADQRAADTFIELLLERLGVRALDPEGAGTTGIFGNG